MTDQISSTFAALADPTRRAILARLALGETSVTELAAPFEMSMPAVSQALEGAREGGVDCAWAEAQWRPCKLKAEPLREACGLPERVSPVLGGEFRSFRGVLEDSAGEGEGTCREKEMMWMKMPLSGRLLLRGHISLGPGSCDSFLDHLDPFAG